jgi:hypothetical protein
MTPTATERSTMIAVFTNRDQANQAIDNLRRVGYSYEHIRLVDRKANSFIQDVKSLFTGQTHTNTNSTDDWMKIGVAEQDAHNYQSELDAGRSIVLLKALDNPEQALGILHQSGAYDIASRLRTARPNTTSETHNTNVQPDVRASDLDPRTPNPNGQVRASDVDPRTSNSNGQTKAYDTTQPHQSSIRDEQNVSR